jgi:hypothetical protein
VRPDGYLRCSDGDREHAAAIVRDALEEGRLGLDELEPRLDRVFRSRTYAELDDAMGDLPAWVRHRTPPAPMPVPPPTAPVVPRHRPLRRWVVALLLWWLLWGSVVHVAPGATLAAMAGILVTAFWGFIVLGRRGQRPRRRRHPHLPPPP